VGSGAGGITGLFSGLRVTNRWSSRLRGRQEPRMVPCKELLSVVVVGGAAQLYVMWVQGGRIHKIPKLTARPGCGLKTG
jgi:hypothetical protein